MKNFVLVITILSVAAILTGAACTKSLVQSEEDKLWWETCRLDKLFREKHNEKFDFESVEACFADAKTKIDKAIIDCQETGERDEAECIEYQKTVVHSMLEPLIEEYHSQGIK